MCHLAALKSRETLQLGRWSERRVFQSALRGKTQYKCESTPHSCYNSSQIPYCIESQQRYDLSPSWKKKTALFFVLFNIFPQMRPARWNSTQRNQCRREQITMKIPLWWWHVLLMRHTVWQKATGGSSNTPPKTLGVFRGIRWVASAEWTPRYSADTKKQSLGGFTVHYIPAGCEQYRPLRLFTSLCEEAPPVWTNLQRVSPPRSPRSRTASLAVGAQSAARLKPWGQSFVP